MAKIHNHRKLLLFLSKTDLCLRMYMISTVVCVIWNTSLRLTLQMIPTLECATVTSL